MRVEMPAASYKIHRSHGIRQDLTAVARETGLLVGGREKPNLIRMD
jgi:hypothetical protein